MLQQNCAHVFINQVFVNKTIVPTVVNTTIPNNKGRDKTFQNEQREECIKKGWKPLF